MCHVKSPYLGPPIMATDPGPISITIGPGRRTVEIHRGNRASNGTCTFRGLDDKEYRWRPARSSRLWGNTMEVRARDGSCSMEMMTEGRACLGFCIASKKCLNAQDRVVATYRMTLFAISKDGELCIYQV